MIFDSHTHLYLSKTLNHKESCEKVMQDENLGGVLNIGINLETSLECLEYAKKYEKVFASVGFHPCDSVENNSKFEEVFEGLEKILKEEKVVAIGETGLDFFHIDKNNFEAEKNIQETFFRKQISLAKKYSLPLVIHSRESNEEVLEILKQEKFYNFVFHCFSGNLDFAQKVLEFSPKCFLGIGGIVTFKNSLELQEVVKNIPLENILIETDSPYLAPVPFRGKENFSSLTIYILEKIAKLRIEKKEDLEKIIYENTLKFLNIS